MVYGASPVAHVQKELCSLMTSASKTLDVAWWQYSLGARMLASVRDQVTFLLVSTFCSDVVALPRALRELAMPPLAHAEGRPAACG